MKSLLMKSLATLIVGIILILFQTYVLKIDFVQIWDQIIKTKISIIPLLILCIIILLLLLFLILLYRKYLKLKKSLNNSPIASAGFNPESPLKRLFGPRNNEFLK